MTWEFGIDFDGDGFVNFDTTLSDPLNLITDLENLLNGNSFFADGNYTKTPTDYSGYTIEHRPAYTTTIDTVDFPQKAWNTTVSSEPNLFTSAKWQAANVQAVSGITYTLFEGGASYAGFGGGLGGESDNLQWYYQLNCSGSATEKIHLGGNGTTVDPLVTTGFRVQPSTQYTFVVWVQGTSNFASATGIALRGYKNFSTTAAFDSGTLTWSSRSTWQKFSYTFTSPASPLETMAFEVEFLGAASNLVANVGGFMLVEGATVPSAWNNGYDYAAGETENINVSASTQYTVSCYLKGISDLQNIQLAAYNQADSQIAISSALLLTTNYQKYSLTFTTGGSDTSVYFKVVKASATNTHFDFTAAMFVAGSSTPTFNSGTTASLYGDIADYITGNAITWFIGCRPLQYIADESSLFATLNNQDGIFSPEDNTSALFGNLVANRKCILRYGSTVLFTGYTEAFQPSPFNYGRQTTDLRCKGRKWQLDTAIVPSELHENITADTVINQIATDAGLLSHELALETGTRIFRYFGDNLNTNADRELEAYKVLTQLAKNEGGKVLFNESGQLVFWTYTKYVAQGTTDVTLDKNQQGLVYAVGDNNDVNVVKVTYYPRTESPNTDDELFDLKDEWSLQPSEKKEYYLHYNDGNNNAAGGRGISIPTADLETIGGNVDITTTAYGQYAKVEIENVDEIEARVRGLKVEGQKITSPSPITIYVEDTTRKERDGTRMLKLDLKAISNEVEATNRARFELVWRTQFQYRFDNVTLTSKGDGTANATQLNNGIGDTVRLIDGKTAHDGNYIIVGAQHTVNIKTKEHSTIWFVEPSIEDYFGIFDDSLFQSDLDTNEWIWS